MKVRMNTPTTSTEQMLARASNGVSSSLTIAGPDAGFCANEFIFFVMECEHLRVTGEPAIREQETYRVRCKWRLQRVPVKKCGTTCPIQASRGPIPVWS